MTRLLRASLLAAATVSACAPAAAAQDLTTIRVSQARAHADHVQAYVATLGRDLQPAAPPSGARFQASLGEKPLRVAGVQPFDRSGEGVGYVFLVDVSRSLSPTQFEEMRQSVNAWIGSMGPRDRAAVVSFGSDVRIAANFTANRDTLRAALARLQPADDHTELYAGIAAAMQFDQRSDPTLPDRRVVVLLSDGESDSPSGTTKQELLERIAATRLPIYSIGYGAGGGRTAAARRGLATLAEVTRRSGGSYVDAGTPDLRTAYAGLLALVRSVYVLRLECDACIRSASTARLEVGLTTGSSVVSDALDLRVPVIPPRPFPWRWVALGAGMLALLAMAGILLWRRRRKVFPAKPAVVLPPPPMPARVPSVGPAAAPPARLLTAVALPAPPPAVRPTPARGPEALLTVVDAQSEVSARVVDLGESRIVGRDQHRADVAFPEDETMSSRHFELMVEGGVLVVRDLDSTNGTLLNGVVVRPAHRVEDGDVIGAGNTRFRVNFPFVQAGHE